MRQKSCFLTIFTALAIGVTAPAVAPIVANAEAPPAPEGPVVLVVDGAVGPVEMDMAGLKTLPRAEFSTTTLWTSGVTEFAGVRLSDLLAAVGAEGGGMLTATALNDYKVEIPVSDASPDGPIVAYEMDGAAMSVREKGPLWIVYPYDSDSRFQTEEIYSRSIWQLTRITIDD